ncbi:hypothetical protein EDB89DRAFT_1972947 [Lactarius sanguifluus]|nr:hypothetical protein EDB89DRAFT_2002253 [Lactarius sanguifluus]KAH9171268.1 hypothetical protein EDB89DRAFT_1972947 [Lactarius sanguifluus]
MALQHRRSGHHGAAPRHHDNQCGTLLYRRRALVLQHRRHALGLRRYDTDAGGWACDTDVALRDYDTTPHAGPATPTSRRDYDTDTARCDTDVVRRDYDTTRHAGPATPTSHGGTTTPTPHAATPTSRSGAMTPTPTAARSKGSERHREAFVAYK